MLATGRRKSHRVAPALAAAAVTLCACGRYPAASTQDGRASLSNAVAVRATDLGVLPSAPAVVGRDGAYSAAFRGKSVWLYGDTILSHPNADGRTFLTNTASFTADLDARDGITGFQEHADGPGPPTTFLRETAEEAAFNAAHEGDACSEPPCGARWAIWPSSIVVDPVADRALVFYSVVAAMPGELNFQGVGTSVAAWQTFSTGPQRPAFRRAIVPDHPDLMFNSYEPNFGSAELLIGRTLYVYGCGVDTDGLDKGCRLGRVDSATVQDRNTWTFRSAGGWSASTADAAVVFDGDDILSVSWNDYLQRYVAVYSALFSQNVMIRIARAPEGPWSGELLAFAAKEPVDGNTYDAHAHSEYDANGGRTLFVTYSRRLSRDGASEIRLVRLDLQLIGPLP